MVSSIQFDNFHDSIVQNDAMGTIIKINCPDLFMNAIYCSCILSIKH